MIPTYLSKIQFNFFNLKGKKERTKNLFNRILLRKKGLKGSPL